MAGPQPLLPPAKDWRLLTVGIRRVPGLPAGSEPHFKPLMDAIDADLDLYAKAFSMMAKRNLAGDLLRKIGAWRQEWTARSGGQPFPNLMARLQGQAEAALMATGGVAKRKYDSVVCVGYVVSTGAWDPMLMARKHLAVVQYGSLAATDRGDMAIRCQRLITAIREAYDAYAARYPAAPALPNGLTPPDRTLRIFMAPEFYFRGINGAYEANVAFDILPLLRAETDKARYRDWLFVFGTVIMGTFVTETICPSCHQTLEPDQASNTANFTATRTVAHKTVALTCNACNQAGRQTYVGAMIDNIALVQKGGEKDGKNTYIATKEYVSGVDFRRIVPPPRRQGGRHGRINMPDWWNMAARGKVKLFGRNVTVMAPDGSNDPSARYKPAPFTDERMGGAVFEMDGIRFGIEICLDHLQNRLNGAENVAVQLVPSAGMDFKRFATVPNGIFFGVDGGSYLQSQAGVNGPHPAVTCSETPVSVGKVVVYDAFALP